ncbi:MAG: hypothetical protein DWQ34_19310 [Planctomycetota bacterium]|nr:MAG: hypothetical protein DWQ34_19310 [Planctomycetota bacterium]
MNSRPQVDLVSDSAGEVRCDDRAVEVHKSSDLSAKAKLSGTHLARGRVEGSVNAARVLAAAEEAGEDEQAIVVLPLASYDWVARCGRLPASLFARLPFISDGVLTVERRKAQPHREPPLQAVLHSRAGDEQARRLIVLEADPPAAQPEFPFRPPPLAPRGIPRDAEEGLHSFEPDSIANVQSRPDAVALRAGLLQMHDLLEASHAESQSVEGEGLHRAGDYWHAIMHRREPDYGNSKYWFRRVDRHPLFPELADRAAALLSGVATDVAGRFQGRLKLSGEWDPFAFVDLCEELAGEEESDAGLVARRIQWEEMLLLLEHTCRDAFGEGALH